MLPRNANIYGLGEHSGTFRFNTSENIIRTLWARDSPGIPYPSNLYGSHPIYFEYPFSKVDDVSIELPLDWQVSTTPKPQNTDGHVVAYEMKVESSKGMLHLERTLNVDILGLEVKYYAALRSFFHTVKTGDEQQIVLQPGQSAARN